MIKIQKAMELGEKFADRAEAILRQWESSDQDASAQDAIQSVVEHLEPLGFSVSRSRVSDEVVLRKKVAPYTIELYFEVATRGTATDEKILQVIDLAVDLRVNDSFLRPIVTSQFVRYHSTKKTPNLNKVIVRFQKLIDHIADLRERGAKVGQVIEKIISSLERSEAWKADRFQRDGFTRYSFFRPLTDVKRLVVQIETFGRRGFVGKIMIDRLFDSDAAMGALERDAESSVTVRNVYHRIVPEDLM